MKTHVVKNETARLHAKISVAHNEKAFFIRRHMTGAEGWER